MQAAVSSVIWFGGVLSLTLLWPVLGILLKTFGAALLFATLPRLLRQWGGSTAQAQSIAYQRSLSPSTRLQLAVGGCHVRGNLKLQPSMEGDPASFDAAMKEWCRHQLDVRRQGSKSISLCPPNAPFSCKHRASQVVLRSIQDSKLEAAEVQVLLQDETEAASWVQEAIRLFGPSEHIPPLGSAGIPLDEWQTLEPADWDEAPPCTKETQLGAQSEE